MHVRIDMLREIDLRRRNVCGRFFSSKILRRQAVLGRAWPFLYQKQVTDLKGFLLTGRCRKGRAYQDAGKRQALCQISMIFDLSQIKSTKTTNREKQSWKKENTHFTTDIQKVKYANITAEELEVLNIFL